MSTQTAAEDSGVQYTLIFVNNSTNFADACVYQQDPNISSANPLSLAWFTKAAYPGTNVIFQWSINYNFVWSQTGTLAPGVIFTASQHPSADLSTTNKITLTKVGGAYNFINQGPGTPGTLNIIEDGTVPKYDASVGIGMSGFGTFVVQAQPNWNLNFTPHPEYWITFGTYTQGQVMDISSISNPQQIEFPENVYSLTATLDSNNNWTVMQTATMNAQYLTDKRRYPELVWGQDPEDPTQARRGRHAGELPSRRYDG